MKLKFKYLRQKSLRRKNYSRSKRSTVDEKIKVINDLDLKNISGSRFPSVRTAESLIRNKYKNYIF